MATRSIAIIGCGGMGLAVARRLGAGRRVFLADFSDKVSPLQSKP
jgi:3-hydroxyisobutyrate dehydrogenase-like beta-hydroxyacid dehydrogenase